jgi:hypothetical protein
MSILDDSAELDGRYRQLVAEANMEFELCAACGKSRPINPYPCVSTLCRDCLHRARKIKPFICRCGYERSGAPSSSCFYCRTIPTLDVARAVAEAKRTLPKPK